MTTSISLSDAKARLSEVVRTVRQSGEEMIITVDGQPAARVVPIVEQPRNLTVAEIATYRVLMRGLLEAQRVARPFDAVDLVGEGRR
jgi:prevent-host-death family protein